VALQAKTPRQRADHCPHTQSSGASRHGCMGPPIKFPRGEVNVKKIASQLLNSAPHCPMAQGPGAAFRGCKGTTPIEFPLAEVNAKQIRMDPFLDVCLGVSQLIPSKRSEVQKGIRMQPLPGCLLGCWPAHPINKPRDPVPPPR